MIENAKKIQKILVDNGYNTLACGGFVRDYLLNQSYKDIDLATQATPDIVSKILIKNNIKVIETGLKHGTVTAVLNGYSFEITTLRKDISCDGRHADTEYTDSFEEDSKRRDFTVNAMYMNLNSLNILDFHNGLSDLKNQMLRFVGNPEDRIKEDYLRILRLFRFSRQLKFDFVDSPEIIEYYNRLWFLSPERIKSELDKIFNCDKVSLGGLLGRIFTCLFPELKSCNIEQNNNYHQYNVLEHIFKTVNFCPPNSIIRWAALFHDLGKVQAHSKDENNIDHFYSHEKYSVEIGDRIMQRMKFSNKEREIINWLVQNHMRIGRPTKKIIRTLMKEATDLGDIDYLNWLINLKKADTLSGSSFAVSQISNWENEVSNFIQASKDMKEKFKLNISGYEIAKILKIGLPNKKIGIINKYLTDKVIKGELNNDNESLKNYLTFNFYNKDDKHHLLSMLF
jgi:tRNA nucleotidyltransferase (CCA-adding enzyme)